LVSKIAGAAADIDMSLHEVADIAKMTASRIGSLSVELEPGKLRTMFTENGSQSDIRLHLVGDNMMIGAGMHGEKSGVISPFVSTDYVANTLVYKIYEYGYIPFKSKDIRLMQPGDKVAVLVNNLGGLSAQDLLVFSRRVVKYLEEEPIGCLVIRLYVGTFMTSLDMKGASVSILYLDEDDTLIDLLDRSTDAPEWKSVDLYYPTVGKLDSETNHSRPSFKSMPKIEVKEVESGFFDDLGSLNLKIIDFHEVASKYIRNSCEAVMACQDVLDNWGSVAGSENFGFKICLVAQRILSHLNKDLLHLSHPITLFQSLKDLTKISAADFTFGNLICFLFSQMLSCLIQSQKEHDIINEFSLREAFAIAVDKLSFYTGAKVGNRTMIDALIPAVQTTKSHKNIYSVAAAAKQGAESTITMSTASFGHAYYKADNEYVGYPDVGAMVIAIIFDAFANGSDSCTDYIAMMMMQTFK